MHVGGMRRLEIAPRLAYGERGVPGIVPPNAVITAEITVLEQCDSNRSP
jgi:FKBP-type peptidyl-prolyl cis-trans isomerase